MGEGNTSPTFGYAGKGKRMQNFIMKPSIELYPGIRVTKDTALEYKNDRVEQKLEGLEFHSVTHVAGDGFESVYDTTIHLEEGDILIFDDGGRGYIKPVEPIMSIREAIEELENIESLGE